MAGHYRADAPSLQYGISVTTSATSRERGTPTQPAERSALTRPRRSTNVADAAAEWLAMLEKPARARNDRAALVGPSARPKDFWIGRSASCRWEPREAPSPHVVQVPVHRYAVWDERMLLDLDHVIDDGLSLVADRQPVDIGGRVRSGTRAHVEEPVLAERGGLEAVREEAGDHVVREESMPQSVWWMTNHSLVPSSLYEITRERIASSDALPPALRITCASPSLSPAYFAGSRRASMHVRMANPRAGGRASSPLSNAAAYASFAARTSSRTGMAIPLTRDTSDATTHQPLDADYDPM